MKHFKFEYFGGYITTAVVAETVEEALAMIARDPSIVPPIPFWELVEDETFEVEMLEDMS